MIENGNSSSVLPGEFEFQYQHIIISSLSRSEGSLLSVDACFEQNKHKKTQQGDKNRSAKN